MPRGPAHRASEPKIEICLLLFANLMVSDTSGFVKTITVTEAARNFSKVLDEVERGQKEIVLVRNHREIVRLVPETSAQSALEILGDLYRTLDEKTADSLLKGIKRGRKRKGIKIRALRNPWVP